MDGKIIKKTQDTLGKAIKKPPLTEKLLTKPPFRFLHDIITEVVKKTGTLKGLYTDDEMNSSNVTEKDAKMAFLQKAIDVIGIMNGDPLSVRPSKIVAGHEAEKTNEFLQALGTLCLNKVDTSDGVKKVLAGEKPNKKSSSKSSKDKDKESKSKDDKKSHSKDKEKPREKDKDRSKEKEKSKDTENEEKKTSKSKDDKHRSEDRDKEKSRHRNKEREENGDRKDRKHRDESGHRKDEKSKDERKDKDRKRESSKEKEKDHKRKEDKENRSNSKERQGSSKERQGSSKERHGSSKERHESKERERSGKERSSRKDSDHHSRDKEKNKEKERSSKSEKHQDEKIVDKKQKENESSRVDQLKRQGSRESSPKVLTSEFALDDDEDLFSEDQNTNDNTDGDDNQGSSRSIQRPASAKGQRRRPSNPDSDDELEQDKENISPTQKVSGQETTAPVESAISSNDVRKQSSVRRPARPSSARPAPPRLKKAEPVEETPRMPQPIAPVIMDKKKEEEDEDDTFIVEEDPSLQNFMDAKSTPSNESFINTEEHGSLVRKMLDSKKEAEAHSQSTNKKDDQPVIYDAVRRKEREIAEKEIEKLRGSIQNLVRSAHPLGKIMDYIQEDIDSMKKELKVWSDENKQHEKELKAEESITESEIEPLQVHLNELESDISELMESISNVKSNILRNEEKIEDLMSGVTR